jgi:DNA repair protein RadA/Sms
MVKQKTKWCCAECGHNESKWIGSCPQCSKWNTFHEEIDFSTEKKRFESKERGSAKPVKLKDISFDVVPRMKTQISELDRLLGGGLTKGSLILVGGDPGIGKSTLLLQTSAALGKQGLTILYVCGEESVEQTSMRAQRLSVESDHLYLLSETNFAEVLRHIDDINPDVVIVDSIQIMYKGEIASAPGSVSQVRETATEFMHLAKGRGITIFLIGHVTKSGEIAGPRVLEHIVDTVLYFEGDKQHHFRMVRVVKNRFGSTDEIGVFQMGQNGLSEVLNPSEIFLQERMKESSGSCIIPTMEGMRPILIEVQALVTNTVFSTPSRRSAGIDQNRLALLLAVLEKRMGFQLHNRDVFVSVAGGIRIIEPAIDMGILLSIVSSFSNKVIDSDCICVGEVGLGGEIRSVARLESRLKEAIHMGFKKAIIPKRNLKGVTAEIHSKLKVTGVEIVDEAIDAVFK